MKLTLITLAIAASLPAQQPTALQPTIDNAKLETRAINGAIAAALSQAGPGPYWAAWSEPIIAGRHDQLCSWNRNSYDDSGRTLGSPMRLEGEPALVLLIRVEFGQIGELRLTSQDCHLDAGGLPFFWFTGVSDEQSITWLRTQVLGSHGDTAVMAIAYHQSTAADQALDDLTSLNQAEATRKRAAGFLGSLRGTHGVATLKRMLATDPSPDVRDRVVLALSQTKDPAGIALVIDVARSDKDAHLRGQALMWLAQRAAAQVSKDAIQNAIANDPESAVRERAVQALTQIPNGGGLPMLIDLAKNHRDPNVRKKAMQSLGQSKDPRAVEFFAQVLKP